MRYARIEDGQVLEFLEYDGDITKIFQPDYLWIDVTGNDDVKENWVATTDATGAHTFQPQPESVTTDQIISVVNINIQAALQDSFIYMSALQGAVDLDLATDKDKGQLLLWKKYRLDLFRVKDQDGFPTSIIWPQRPEF